MIRIENRTLPPALEAQLQAFQEIINREADYHERVKLAESEWKRKRRRRALTQVRLVLDEMCSGNTRCMYCEDSLANQIEHYKPRAIYPEATFVWANYLYACSPCNSKKSDSFGIVNDNDEVVNLTNMMPLIDGEAALLNPRYEDAMHFIFLDLAETFRFRPVPTLDERQKKRAEHTIDVLNLNRDPLVRQRSEAYDNYVARLEQYLHHRQRGAAAEVLGRMVDKVQKMAHPTVWHEMKRQRTHISKLNHLFKQIPAALEW